MPIGERARGAERVVVATILSASPSFRRNEFGDQLIISRALLNVEEVLKGEPSKRLVFEVEGGTIGDLSLHVSDLPEVKAGQRGIFFLARNRAGNLEPYLRGFGIVELVGNSVRNSSLRLDDVRQLIRAALPQGRD